MSPSFLAMNCCTSHAKLEFWPQVVGLCYEELSSIHSQAHAPMQDASAGSSVLSSCQAIHRADFNETSGFLSLVGLAERSSHSAKWASLTVGGACIPNVLSMFVCSPDSATHTCLFRHTDFPTVQEAGCMLRTLKTASK